MGCTFVLAERSDDNVDESEGRKERGCDVTHGSRGKRRGGLCVNVADERAMKVNRGEQVVDREERRGEETVGTVLLEKDASSIRG